MNEFTLQLIAYSAVAFLSALIGATEMMSRYPDSPFRALRNYFGMSYLLINAAASVATLYLIREFQWDFGMSGGVSAPHTYLLQCLAAAFSAMSILRSSLFNVRIGDNDLSVGPAAVLQVLLSAADRQVDRMRAEERSAAVKHAMNGIDAYEEVKIALPTHCMALMQNVSSEEEKHIRQIADNIEQLDIPDCLKVLNLGLVLMNVVGDAVLRTAVHNVVQAQLNAGAKARAQAAAPSPGFQTPPSSAPENQTAPDHETDHR